MCNINFIYNKNKEYDPILSQFMNHASYESSRINTDGEGAIWFEGEKSIKTRTEKTMGKLYFPYDNSWALLSHQRLATSGMGENNTHPHRVGDLELVHNGVFVGLGDNKRSDTAYYLESLNKYYKKYKGNLIKAIQVLNKKSSGSYSIFVYNHATQKLYYYKNTTTQMSIAVDDDYIVMSTFRPNVIFAFDCLRIGDSIEPVEPCKIYDVFDNMRPVAEFEEFVWKGKVNKPVSFGGKTYNNRNNYVSDREVDELLAVTNSIPEHERYDDWFGYGFDRRSDYERRQNNETLKETWIYK